MIEKLSQHYSMTNPASVYDEEALTALELAARTNGKVNEVVEEVNTIPDKVEKAIDDVLTGGTFDRLIDSKLDNISERLENLSGHLTDTSSKFDAEIVDARIDSEGHVYENLGAAVRGLEAQTKREINRFVSVNRLNPQSVILGYVNPEFGTINESTDYNTSDYIPIGAGETVALYYRDMTPRQFRFVAAYDKNKEFLSTMGATDVLSYTQRGDVGYIRVSYKRLDTPENYMVSNVDTSSFSPYGDGAIVDSAIPDSMRNTTEKLVYTNRYRVTDEVVGYYVNNLTGLLQENASYFSTGFIRVKEQERLSVYNEDMNVLPIRMGAYFNKEGKYLSGFSTESTVIVVPYGAYYVRFSMKIEYQGHLMLTEPNAHKFVNAGDVALRKEVSFGASTSYDPANKVATYKADTVEAGEVISLTDFPKYINRGFRMSLFASCSTIPTIKIGKGDANNEVSGSRQAVVSFYGGQCEILTNYNENGFADMDYVGSDNITAQDFIHIVVDFEPDKTMKVSVTSNNTSGSVSHFGITIPENYYYATGAPFFKTTQQLKNVTFSVSAKALESDVWVIGDSYMGMSDGRVMGQLLKTFNIKNVYVCAKPGLGSAEAFDDLQLALNYHRPRTLVWYVGINDEYETYQNYVNRVRELCSTYNIDLVLNMIPSTPTLDRTSHRNLVKNIGERYVDSYGAVSGHMSSNQTAWGNGLLSADNTHPTIKGACVLAARLVTDVPELLDERGV